jgi:hypothetical protein
MHMVRPKNVFLWPRPVLRYARCGSRIPHPPPPRGELVFKGVFSVGFPGSLLGGFPCDSGPLNGR